MISTTTNDGILFKLAGASYTVYTSNRDNSNNTKPLRFYDHCLNGFNGAFASNCIEGYTALLLDYAKPLIGYGLEPIHNTLLKWYTEYNILSLINPDSINNLFIAANTLLSSRPEILIATALALALTAFILKRKLENLQSIQMLAAVIASVTAAKISNLFSPTLVYIIYTTLYLRRTCTCFKKLTNPICRPIENKFISIAEKFYPKEIKKEELKLDKTGKGKKLPEAPNKKKNENLTQTETNSSSIVTSNDPSDIEANDSSEHSTSSETRLDDPNPSLTHTKLKDSSSIEKSDSIDQKKKPNLKQKLRGLLK